MIFLIRHGEAAAGWGDHPDPGLSALGVQQAEVAASGLIQLGASQAISSPMQRCQETADVFCTAAGIEKTLEPAVSEIVTPSGIDDRVSWLREIMAGTWSQAGEAYERWRQTAVEAVSSLPDGTAVFSHFVAINAIVSALEGRNDVVVFRPGHCSITQLSTTADGNLRVAFRGQEFATRVL